MEASDRVSNANVRDDQKRGWPHAAKFLAEAKVLSVDVETEHGWQNAQWIFGRTTMTPQGMKKIRVPVSFWGWVVPGVKRNFHVLWTRFLLPSQGPCSNIPLRHSGFSTVALQVLKPII